MSFFFASEGEGEQFLDAIDGMKCGYEEFKRACKSGNFRRLVQRSKAVQRRNNKNDKRAEQSQHSDPMTLNREDTRKRLAQELRMLFTNELNRLEPGKFAPGEVMQKLPQIPWRQSLAKQGLGFISPSEVVVERIEATSRRKEGAGLTTMREILGGLIAGTIVLRLEAFESTDT